MIMLLTIILGNSRGCKKFSLQFFGREKFYDPFYGCFFEFLFVAFKYFLKINKTPALHKVPFLRGYMLVFMLHEPIKFPPLLSIFKSSALFLFNEVSPSVFPLFFLSFPSANENSTDSGYKRHREEIY